MLKIAKTHRLCFPYFLPSYSILFMLFFLGCSTKKKETGFKTVGMEGYSVKQIGKLPPEINECSGLVLNTDESFWTHNDGGSKPALFRINKKGKLLQTINLPKLKNNDWEELTSDAAGNLYIGDFGNNNNARNDLKIYKLNPENPEKADSITFHYTDQTEFPPPYNGRHFDCEAFFWYKGNLYLFTKNRGSKYVKYYVIPDKPGDYAVQPSASSVYLQQMVTGAAISPKKDFFALMAYGKVYFFKLTDEKNLFATPYLCLKMSRGQTEALTFVSEKDIIFSNEQSRIFSLQLKDSENK